MTRKHFELVAASIRENLEPGVGGASIMPYMGIERDQLIRIKVGRKVRRFRIATYRAYNAMGLIGSERNGVVVFDEDNRRVLCDEIGKTSSAYCGVGLEANNYFELLTTGVSWEDFRNFINDHPRTRYQI